MTYRRRIARAARRVASRQLMSRPATLLTVAFLVGCGTSDDAQERTRAPTSAQTMPISAPPRERPLYGHVVMIERADDDDGFEIAFDPAFWLEGQTAARAAADDGRIEAGEPVPNDYYVRDESDLVLAFFAPNDVPVTVLTLAEGRVESTRITVGELADIVAGEETTRRLYGRELGYWIRLQADTIVSIDQQYQP
jgi:hypothetical protein